MSDINGMLADIRNQKPFLDTPQRIGWSTTQSPYVWGHWCPANLTEKERKGLADRLQTAHEMGTRFTDDNTADALPLLAEYISQVRFWTTIEEMDRIFKEVNAAPTLP